MNSKEYIESIEDKLKRLCIAVKKVIEIVPIWMLMKDDAVGEEARAIFNLAVVLAEIDITLPNNKKEINNVSI